MQIKEYKMTWCDYLTPCEHFPEIEVGSYHCSCIIDGRINDIWNCSYDKVGKMWAIIK